MGKENVPTTKASNKAEPVEEIDEYTLDFVRFEPQLDNPCCEEASKLPHEYDVLRNRYNELIDEVKDALNRGENSKANELAHEGEDVIEQMYALEAKAGIPSAFC